MTTTSSNPIFKQALENVVFHQVDALCNPAFTEASAVSCHSEACFATVRRLSTEDHHCLRGESYIFDGTCLDEMDLDAGSAALQRTTSQHSYTSGKSSRSQTMRTRPRKYASYMSSSASSISDKSLTSFPSFSPESPKAERTLTPKSVLEDPTISRKPSDGAFSIVNNLSVLSPSTRARTALFEDTLFESHHVPGTIHNASDEHIERLIARNGAVAFIRQIAEDLAQRDAQMAALRRKTEERERALRKIVRECGVSNLDMETRLRALEAEQRAAGRSNSKTTSVLGLEDMMSDAIDGTVAVGELGSRDSDATIRAVDKLRALEDKPRNVSRGWKDYIWGGTSKQSSRASSINEDAVIGGDPGAASTVINGNRKSVLQNGLFQPPGIGQNSDQTSSHLIGSSDTKHRDRKPSSGLATFALKLVAGKTIIKESDASSIRGRANSTGTAPIVRDQSTASAKTTASARPALTKLPPKTISSSRRTTIAAKTGQIGTVRGPSERWDTMGASPPSTISGGNTDNYGPVEMDTILPPDTQPPTLTHIYNNTYNQEFLTDRFGFIYDQRRKRRQKEAAEKTRRPKRGSRVEMLSSARSGVSADISDSDAFIDGDEDRPDTPLSGEAGGDDEKQAKRWQDYLKIATFPTELLSHTPSGAVPALEVMEGGEVPTSPGITTEERGFLPSASTTAMAQPTVQVLSDNATISKPVTTSPETQILLQEDTEPVKLLLKQLGDVHDSLQRDKTVRWNDFLRKVRAERKRDGEAAAAALAATAEQGLQKPIAIMPEATLADGEMIGVAGLGNKGKVGRAKWNEFKGLVLGGIPVAYRAKIWAECSGAVTLRVPGYYENLVSTPTASDDPAIIAQIQMDINRTLTDNIFFRKGPGVTKLNEVLLAYSRRNAEVGYCQGMNLITACLLLIMPTAEDAFWILASIIENILPRGYYDHQLLASRADQQVLRQYVTEILPKLSQHLDDLSIELEALTFQWFLSVFTDCLSAEALFRVWDVVFCTNDGSTFLFQVALALLKLNEKELLGCATPAGVYTYINHQMTNHAISIDGLIHASEGLKKVVKREDVENRRRKAIDAERNLMRLREERNALRRSERLTASRQEFVIEESLESPEELDGELTIRTPRPIDENLELRLD